MSNKGLKKSPGIDTLLEVGRILHEGLVENGIDNTIAHNAAMKAVEHFRSHHGGTEFYVPKGQSLIIEKRDWEIWEKFNGHNIDELAKEYNLCSRQIRTIIAKCREQYDAERNLDLFA
ncbi:Mor transcription activator family protein [Desulfuromonas acetoxidans]|uniref:Mor transcription activator family protein n=1 Tax=Desulfuromonas acetoxidans TaxID=891 RepID=UPI0029315C85|nr:Mor transcription activator family protein [Desulfuromonas acetoxidans]